MAYKRRILVIDDDPDILITLKQVLETEGYKVYSLDDGRDCLTLLNKWKKPPSLIILDIMMPGMSGWEIHRRIELNPKWRKIPILFLTGRTTDTAVEMYKRYGTEHMQKPFDLDDLKSRVNKILESN